MKNVLVVMGTRPEVIKLAPVIWKLEESKELEPVVCVTSQHKEMLEDALEVFKITPKFDLDIMTARQSLAHVLMQVLRRMGPVFEFESIELTVVQGDTTSALGAALASYYEKVPVAHVEAGLRSHNRYNPFPEEMNRAMIDQLSTLAFPPTEKAWIEGIPKDCAKFTGPVGNTVIDVVQWAAQQKCDIEAIPMDWIRAAQKRIVLVTAHRRESFGKPLENICDAVIDLSDAFPDCVFVWPVHLNPDVQGTVLKRLSNREWIMLTAPLKYLEFVQLMKESYLILTDSGGLQEEAAALNIPVLVMRTETERWEAIEAGTARLVGTNAQNIFTEASRLLIDPIVYGQMRHAENPFGDGRSAEKIVLHLEKYLNS